MGATESRPRETRDGDGEEEIAVSVAVVGLGVAVAAGATVVRLGVAAWNAVRRLASPSPPQHHKKRTFEFIVDGSVGEDLEDPSRTKKGGSGGVLRNEKGVFLCEFYEHLGKETDPVAAEVTAIKGALEVFTNNKFKWDGQYDELIVKSDSASAVRFAKAVRSAKGEQGPSKYRHLLDGINRSVSAIGEVGFDKVERDYVREADELATRGRKYLGADNTNRRVASCMKSF